MIIEYNSKNAIEYFKYAAIYPKSEIKKHIQYLYGDFFYCLGIEQGGKPVGFIAVERRNKRVYVCNWIFVEKEHRGRGLAKKLLVAALNKAESEEGKSFYASFFENRNWTEAAKHLYQKEGFEESGYVRQTFVVDKCEIKKSIDILKEKYSRYLALRSNYTIKMFSDLTTEERSKIKEQLGVSIPYNFNPLNTQSDGETSTFIFDKTDPVAWIIFEKNTSAVLYVHQLYVKEAYRNKGLFFPLFCSAFNNTPERVKRYFFYVNGDNDKMLGLLRLFESCEIKREKMIEMVKQL